MEEHKEDLSICEVPLLKMRSMFNHFVDKLTDNALFLIYTALH